MQASFVDLRTKTAEILKAIQRNESITLLYRGKPTATITPLSKTSKKLSIKTVTEDPAFGMWRDREDMKDVPAYIRRLRKGRRRDL